MQVNIAKIIGLMAEHGETQQDLARVLGCSVTTVGNYMTSKSVMRVDDVGKIAVHYEVSPLDLLKTTQK